MSDLMLYLDAEVGVCAEDMIRIYCGRMILLANSVQASTNIGWLFSYFVT